MCGQGWEPLFQPRVQSCGSHVAEPPNSLEDLLKHRSWAASQQFCHSTKSGLGPENPQVLMSLVPGSRFESLGSKGTNKIIVWGLILYHHVFSTNLYLLYLSFCELNTHHSYEKCANKLRLCLSNRFFNKARSSACVVPSSPYKLSSMGEKSFVCLFFPLILTGSESPCKWQTTDLFTPRNEHRLALGV